MRTDKDRVRDLSQHETLYQSQDPRDQELLRRQQLAGERTTIGVMASGSSLETLGGLGAVVLSVLGLSAYLPVTMAAIATIAIGIALLAQGGAIAARWRETLHRLDGARFDRDELIGGVGTEVFGGLVGVVLGVLVLAGQIPRVLLPVASIVFGCALLFGGAAQPDLAELTVREDPRYRRFTHDAVQSSGGVMVFVGLAAAVLGILGLLQVSPVVTLSLVSLLCIGGALLLAGGALTARFLGHLR